MHVEIVGYKEDALPGVTRTAYGGREGSRERRFNHMSIWRPSAASGGAPPLRTGNRVHCLVYQETPAEIEVQPFLDSRELVSGQVYSLFALCMYSSVAFVLAARPRPFQSTGL